MKKILLTLALIAMTQTSFASIIYYSDGSYSQILGNTVYNSDGTYAMIL